MKFIAAGYNHGTVSTYNNRKCRCEPCRKAKARDNKRRETKVANKDNPAFKLIIMSAIDSLGGKCVRCGSAHSEENMLVFASKRVEDRGSSIRSMIYKGASLIDIGDNLKKCELVCENCKKGNHESR